MKSVLISEEIHELLKKASRKYGIKIKHMVDQSIRDYLKKLTEKE